MPSSLDMLPCDAKNRIADDAFADSEVFRDGDIGGIANGVPSPRLSHHRFGQRGRMMSFAAHVAALAYLVSAVNSWRPQKEMSRVHAWRVVAFVQDMQIIRDGADAVDPRLPMGINHPTVKGEFPIPASGATSGPDPAPVAFLDVIPEVGFSSRGLGRLATSDRTMLA